MATATATVGGGCFWCLDALLREVAGVQEISSGYSGGEPDQANYQAVCSGTTGHAEVVQIQFDERLLSFRQLLELFFASHDPTTLNRQGNDVGPQYRSVIFYHDESQAQIARELIQALKGDGLDVVTELCPFEAFFSAEDYHQDYYQNNPGQPYCQVVIAPKLAQFRQKSRKKFR